MKKTLLFVLALIAVGCAEGEQEESASCADLSEQSPLEDLRTCAEQGNAVAQTSLGFLYFVGNYVPEDDVLAYMWWNLAAAQGDADAQEGKDLIESRMTREQIAEGQRMSREWLEAHPPGGN